MLSLNTVKQLNLAPEQNNLGLLTHLSSYEHV